MRRARDKNISTIYPIRTDKELKVLPFEEFELVKTVLAVPGFIFVKVDRLSSRSSDNHLALTRDLDNRPAFTGISLFNQPRKCEKNQRYVNWTIDSHVKKVGGQYRSFETARNLRAFT